MYRSVPARERHPRGVNGPPVNGTHRAGMGSTRPMNLQPLAQPPSQPSHGPTHEQQQFFAEHEALLLPDGGGPAGVLPQLPSCGALHPLPRWLELGCYLEERGWAAGGVANADPLCRAPGAVLGVEAPDGPNGGTAAGGASICSAAVCSGASPQREA